MQPMNKTFTLYNMQIEKIRHHGFVFLQGPLINKRQFERVVSLVDSAKKSGVKVVTGENNKRPIYFRHARRGGYSMCDIAAHT